MKKFLARSPIGTRSKSKETKDNSDKPITTPSSPPKDPSYRVVLQPGTSTQKVQITRVPRATSSTQTLSPVQETSHPQRVPYKDINPVDSSSESGSESEQSLAMSDPVTSADKDTRDPTASGSMFTGPDEHAAPPPNLDMLNEQLADLQRQLDAKNLQLGNNVQTIDMLNGQIEKDKQDAAVMSSVFEAADNVKVKLSRDIKRAGACDGLDPQKTLKWVRKLDEMDQPLAVARATSEGPLARTVRTGGTDWQTCKGTILLKHVSPIFSLHQKEKMMKLKQNKSTWLAYDEEFGNLANEAFPECMPEDQEELVKAYVNGLSSEALAYEILKKNPNTLQEAREIANEQQRYTALLGGGTHKTYLSQETESSSGLQTLVKGMETLAQTQLELQKRIEEQAAPIRTPTPKKQGQKQKGQRSQGQTQNPNQRTFKQFTCYRCGKDGHIARNCRAPTNQLPVQNPQQKYQQLPPPQHYPQKPQQVPLPQQKQSTSVLNENKCFRCRQPGHMADQCCAPAPKRPCYCGEYHWLYDCPQRQASQPQGN